MNCGMLTLCLVFSPGAAPLLAHPVLGAGLPAAEQQVYLPSLPWLLVHLMCYPVKRGQHHAFRSSTLSSETYALRCMDIRDEFEIT
jgi:hypothetical protein